VRGFTLSSVTRRKNLRRCRKNAVGCPPGRPECVSGIGRGVVSAANPLVARLPTHLSDGSVRWVHGRSIPEPENNSGTIAWNGILTDVTREKTATEAMKESRRQLDQVVSNLPEWCFSSFFPKWHGRISYVSDRITEYTGYKPDEITRDGRNPFDMVSPDQQKKQSGECRFPRRLSTTGRLRDRSSVSTDLHLASHRATPSRMPDGEIVWNGVALDVTEQKRAEEQLQHAIICFKSSPSRSPA